MKKNAKKKAIATLVALVLVIACAVGATFAWFTDSTEVVTNTFTVGNVEIELYEFKGATVSGADIGTTLGTKNSATINGDYETYLDEAGKFIVPGTTVNKNLYVENTGSNNAYVRILVLVPATLDAYLVKANNTTDWTVSAATDVTYNTKAYKQYVYTHNEVLGVGEYTEAALKTVTLDGETTEEQFVAASFDTAANASFGIIVQAQAIQAENMTDAADAWAKFGAVAIQE